MKAKHLPQALVMLCVAMLASAVLSSCGGSTCKSASTIDQLPSRRIPTNQPVGAPIGAQT